MKRIPYAWTPIIVVFIVLLLDQWLKIWIKTNMCLGQEFYLLGFKKCIIHFTENPGMAFGMKFGGSYGKLFLSLFRIGAVGVIGWYIYKLVKEKAPIGYLLSVALILAGALGNIIDSAFYGMIFSESGYFFDGEKCLDCASVFPAEGGYAPFLHGKVVDMFYFPLLEGHFPTWFPFWGGEDFVFFRPVFNVADSAITCGVVIILIFQNKFFKEPEKAVALEESTSTEEKSE